MVLTYLEVTTLIDMGIIIMDKILTSYPTVGVIVMGDFNLFDCKCFCRDTPLEQIVKKTPTCGNATLDLIFTNMKCWYNELEILPAIGQLDHMSIPVHLFTNIRHPNTVTKVLVRKRKPPNMQAFGLETILPRESVKFHCRDHAWLIPQMKLLSPLLPETAKGVLYWLHTMVTWEVPEYHYKPFRSQISSQ